jgi:hypothetical protein
MNCSEIAELEPLFLSGEMPAEERDSFRAHLAGCRNCAVNVERQQALDRGLRDAFSLPDVSSLQQSVRHQIARKRSSRIAMITAAAAAVLFAVFLGYRLRPGDVLSDAARDHRLEVMEHQPRRWKTDPAEIQKLAARFALADPSTSASTNYHLERAKMCGLAGQPALHLVYSNGVREFSVYVRTRTAADRDPRAVRLGSENLATLQTDRLEAVVVTAGSSSECLEFSRFAATVL